MNYTERIFDMADRSVRDFQGCEAIRFLAAGKLRAQHYAEILKQIFHYTKENPALQALLVTRFKGAQREQVRRMLQHAASEVGHDQLALLDCAALGVDVSAVALQNPLPSTLPMITFPVYQITYRNPLGYLGCILFLERLPTQAGAFYIDTLRAAGIPEKAMSFIREHATVDVHHNKLMRTYLDALIARDSDCDSVCYCLKVMCHFYAMMLWGAISEAEQPNEWGIAHEESITRS